MSSTNNSTGGAAAAAPGMKKAGTILEVKHTSAKRGTLSAYTKRTLGSGNLRATVALPENEDKNEWLAANIVDFFNEVSLLYGLCGDDAARYTKPGEGFPPGFEYRWADGVKITKPVGFCSFSSLLVVVVVKEGTDYD